jgi:hypothetical protein
MLRRRSSVSRLTRGPFTSWLSDATNVVLQTFAIELFCELGQADRLASIRRKAVYFAQTTAS